MVKSCIIVLRPVDYWVTPKNKSLTTTKMKIFGIHSVCALSRKAEDEEGIKEEAKRKETVFKSVIMFKI